MARILDEPIPDDETLNAQGYDVLLAPVTPLAEGAAIDDPHPLDDKSER